MPNLLSGLRGALFLLVRRTVSYTPLELLASVYQCIFFFHGMTSSSADLVVSADADTFGSVESVTRSDGPGGLSDGARCLFLQLPPGRGILLAPFPWHILRA